MLRRVVLVSALLALGSPSGAAALPPPEVFLQAGDGPPVPAAEAVIGWMGSVDVLIRMRPGDPPRGDGTNRNYIRFAVVAQPAGQPPAPGELQCEAAVGAPGELARVGNVNFAGAGRYAIRVVASTAAEWGSAPECPTEPAGEVGWTNDPIPTNGFPDPVNHIGMTSSTTRGSLAIGLPPGTGTRAINAQTSCGLGGTYVGDGRFEGAAQTFVEAAQAFGGLSVADFPGPGRWTCATRLSDENELGFTRWSEPATGDITEDARFTKSVRYGGARGATLSAALVPAAAGSTVELRVRASRLQPRARIRRSYVVRAVVGPTGSFSLATRVRKPGCYDLRLRVIGNRYVLPGSATLVARLQRGRLRRASAVACR